MRGLKNSSYLRLYDFRDFLKSSLSKTVVDRPITRPGAFREELEIPGFSKNRAPHPGDRGYACILGKILIPLATVNAAWRNQASNLFLIRVVNQAYFYMYARWRDDDKCEAFPISILKGERTCMGF
jgi:hypothetical protein